MNRNTESFFQNQPTLEVQRSLFERNFTHKSTGNNGDIIPIFVDCDIFPGWTIQNTTSILIRMQTPYNPTMDNARVDTYWFKVNMYSVYDKIYAIFGENEDGAWTQTTEYTIPMFKTDNMAGRINDMITYMGIRYNTTGLEFSQLPIRAYCRIYNYFFRDQNLIPPLKYPTGEETIQFDGQTIHGGTLAKAAKIHDYFTSALPEPQKGEAVTTPLGTVAPVRTYTNELVVTSGLSPLKFRETGGTSVTGPANLALGPSGNAAIYSTPTVSGYQSQLFPSNLGADLTQAVASTINAQRWAFATQRIYEHDALYGTRRNEIIRKYGVVTSNEGMQVPEYLGGTSFALNIDTCLQTSAASTDSETGLGETGAYSVSFNINEDFTKSFDDWAIVIGLMVVRCDHTYQQGIERQWTRKRRFDFYHPEFSHIGNQPIYNNEIYAQGTSEDWEVFGYKEAWAEYKYKPSRISGEMLSDYAQSLDVWHYADDYDSLPVLSQEWIEEPVEFLDRTLKVKSTTANQFWFDIAVHQVCAAPMPLHCNPGLIDHF